MKYSSAAFRLLEHIGQVADSFLEENQKTAPFQITKVKRRNVAAYGAAAGVTVSAGIAAVYLIARSRSLAKSA